MYKFIFYLSLIVIPPFCIAQTPYPGGVAQPVIWLTPDAYPSKTSDQLLNYYRVPEFNNKQKAESLVLPVEIWNQTTIYSLFLPQDTSEERLVWYLQNDKQKPILLTTHRFVDLNNSNVINTRLDLIGPAQIHGYLHNKQEGKSAEYPTSLYLGTHTGEYKLPAYNFQGFMPEIILYDRVLSEIERSKIETYLALKYGVSFSAFSYKPLISSQEDTLWDMAQNAKWSNSMAGLGRDDASGLYQKQAHSVHNPELLSIGLDQLVETNVANKGILADQEFLIWGHNRANLFFHRRSTGFPEMLKRQWLMEVKANEAFPRTEIAFQISQLPLMADENEIYWLAIDRSASGEFGPGEVDFIPADRIDSDGKAHFGQVSWDSDASGKDIFSIAKGSGMMAVSWLEGMSCFPELNGRLHIQVFGGKQPYEGTLINLSSREKLEINIQNNELMTLDAIEAGKYELVIQDQAGNQHTQRLFLQSQDAPKSLLPSNIVLHPDSSLQLDASLNQTQALTYEWHGPNGFQSDQADIQIEEAGQYALYLNQNGCISRQEILVEAGLNPLFRQISLFPNPLASGEDFHLKILLQKAESLRLQITDALGKSIKSIRLAASDYHFYSDRMFSPGTYYISLQGQTEEQTIRLLVR